MTDLYYLHAVAAGDPGRLPPGVAGRPVCTWTEAGLWILASELAPQNLPAGTQADLCAHAAVVEAAMLKVTVLPFRCNTVVNRPACHLFIQQFGSRIREELERVAGQVEVTLRIYDRGTEPEEVDPAVVDAHRPRRHGLMAGVALALKRPWETMQAADRRKRAVGLLSRLEGSLGGWATERRLALVPFPHVLATLTHLIPLPALGPWAEAAAGLREQYPELEFRAGGPWPPYHFSDVTHHI